MQCFPWLALPHVEEDEPESLRNGFLHRLTIDLFILAVIAVPVTALMFLTPREDMHVERNWGTVFYSDPVFHEKAVVVAELLVEQGLFAGNPMSLSLTHDGEIWQLVIVLPRDFDRLNAREMLAAFARQICVLAFPGTTATFLCVDSEFEPFDVLIPPTRFPKL